MARIDTIFRIQSVDMTFFEAGNTRMTNLPQNGMVRLSVSKNATSKIDFFLKDADRRPIKISGRTLFMIMTDPVRNRQVMKKYLTIVDEIKGQYRAVFSPGDLQDLIVGSYRYSIILVDFDGTENLLYLNVMSQTYAEIEVIDKDLGIFKASTIITYDDFLHRGIHPNNDYLSPRITGDNTTGQLGGLITFAVYGEDDVTGKVYLDASLDSTPDSQDDTAWFPISLSDDVYYQFTVFTGTQYFNATSMATWFRLRFVYDSDNEGSFTQFVVRN